MAPRRRTIREESWDSLHHSEASNEISDQGSSDLDEMEQSDTPQLLTIGDVHWALHPLQATADRVGKQVERFAETLDRLSGQKQQDEIKDCQHVLPFVCEYERIAADTVKRLKRYHEPERQEKLKKMWGRRFRSSNGRLTPTADHGGSKSELGSTTLEDLQHWEQERQTWQLLRIMLQVQYPLPEDFEGLPEQEERFNRPPVGLKVHQYSTEYEVWRSFLGEYDDVWEKNVVVEWLKMCADSSGQDIGSVIEELELGADRGSGLSAHGCLYSKEAIKGQKRLRSWPKPLDPGSPGIDKSLKNTDKTVDLVTQLDPDAFSRQGRSLEKEDVFFERATWLACWEMIRRGRSWESIREWCQERVEGWRALSIRGDPRDAYESGVAGDAIAGWHSRRLWRKICLTAAKEGGIDDYEKAVYGLLSGETTSVEKVVGGWDDYLYSVYNSQLLKQFDFHVQQKLPARLPRTINDRTKSSFFDKLQPPNTSGSEVWKTLLRNDLTKKEASQPIKMLQGSLIAKEFDRYIHNEGASLALHDIASERRLKRLPGNSGNITRAPGPPGSLTFDDHDMLRILTHMILIFTELGYLGNNLRVVENIIHGYVDYLGKAGKQQLLPLYASKLPPRGSIECMARQLPSITDDSERHTVMALMNQYDMNVGQILHKQMLLITSDARMGKGYALAFPDLEILERDVPNEFGLAPIRGDFLGKPIEAEEWDLIHAMEWYLLLEGNWKETMRAGSYAYKYLLRKKAIGAAKELWKRVSFSAISSSKVGSVGDLSREPLSEDDEHSPASQPSRGQRAQQSKQRERRASSTRNHTRIERETLLDQSRTFRDLECMIKALDAIDAWRSVASRRPQQADARHARSWKAELQASHNAVMSSIEPLLHGWLQFPEDDEEAVELNSLRKSALPEILLAYLTVLNHDGHFLSREILLKAMDLAALIAAEGSELALCFVGAGRMAELVETLANVSRSILRADESGSKGGKKARRAGTRGENLEIWSAKVGGVGGGGS